jgi:hypothetical protein
MRQPCKLTIKLKRQEKKKMKQIQPTQSKPNVGSQNQEETQDVSE